MSLNKLKSKIAKIESDCYTKTIRMIRKLSEQHRQKEFSLLLPAPTTTLGHN
jgi:hypothetical protein